MADRYLSSNKVVVFLGVVGHGVAEHEEHRVLELVEAHHLARLDVELDREQVHGPPHHRRVVEEVQGAPVDGGVEPVALGQLGHLAEHHLALVHPESSANVLVEPHQVLPKDLLGGQSVAVELATATAAGRGRRVLLALALALRGRSWNGSRFMGMSALSFLSRWLAVVARVPHRAQALAGLAPADPKQAPSRAWTL